MGLNTGPCVTRPGSVLQAPIFSKADDCAVLVKSCNAMKNNHIFGHGVKFMHRSRSDFLRLGANFFCEA